MISPFFLNLLCTRRTLNFLPLLTYSQARFNEFLEYLLTRFIAFNFIKFFAYSVNIFD